MIESKINDLIVSVEVSQADYIKRTFVDGLVDDGDQVYIRLVNGRLQWRRANKTLADEQWKELTPNLAALIESGGTLPVRHGDEEDSILAVQEPEAYEIGWYQDVKGDLYQFDGKTWVGVIPSKNEIESLEFLG